MNTKGIRFKIISWFTVTLFLVVTTTFASFYLITRQILFAQVDSELKNHSQKFVPALTNRTQIKNIDFSDTPGMVVTLLDQNGSALQSSLSLNSPFVSYKYPFSVVENSPEPVFIDQSISNMPMRFIAVPVRDGDKLLGVVLVAHPIDVIQKSLNILIVALAALLVLLIFPIVIIGNFLAGKMVKPLTEVVNKMQHISSENLDERVNVPKTKDELQSLGITFNSLLDRLQDSFRRERQFIGDMAHELKTPIATLKSEIELSLSKNRTIDEYRKTLESSLIDTNRLSTLTGNILDLAWTRAQKNSGKKFSLSDLIKEMGEIANKLALQKEITIKTDIGDNVFITGFPDKMGRAVLNILDNAIKFTPKGGVVSLNLYKKGNKAQIEIKDTGIGIPAKELPHIFERFYRGTNENKATGTGLGLAISKGIIEMHNGSINIKSKVGVGTIVTIILMNS